MSNVAIQLPPTLGISDQQTRQVLDAIINHLDLRGGVTSASSDERYITLRDFKEAIDGGGSVNPAGLAGGTAGGGGGNALVGLVDTMRNNIQQSLIYQLLETPIQIIDQAPIRAMVNQSLQTAQLGISGVSSALTSATESLTREINAAVSRIASAEAAIIQEQNTRATADTAITGSLNAAISRIGASESAIVTEQNTRNNRDNALAQAVNTIWSQIGNGGALIQDSALAAVSPASIEASQYRQLQVALRDPDNPGQYISSAAVRQDASAALSSTGRLEARYTIKVDLNGYVTGFGLAATENSGLPTSDFQVRADRFSIVNPNGSRSALIMTNNTIKVYDENGVLRVKIGNLNA